jgi:large subunit ribosomal protein L9
MANIQVILTEKIEGLGAEADVVKVRGGHARNYLLPKGLAMEATRGNLTRTAGLKAKRAIREAEELKAAQALASSLKKKVINLTLSTGQGGKAFGAVTAQDIAAAIKEQADLAIDRHDILLEKPIKQLGDFKVEVRIHPNVTGEISLVVAAKE